MPERITQEQVDDFHAQQRGFEDAHAERVAEAEDAVGLVEFEIEEHQRELAELKKRLAEAKKRLRAAKRR